MSEVGKINILCSKYSFLSFLETSANTSQNTSLDTSVTSLNTSTCSSNESSSPTVSSTTKKIKFGKDVETLMEVDNLQEIFSHCIPGTFDSELARRADSRALQKILGSCRRT